VEEAEVYDPNNGTFSLSAKLNIARANHTATKLEDGRIIIIGGHNRDGSLRSTEFFDSRSNVFSPGPSLARARSGHTATTLADGRILIAGGDYDGTAEIFNPASSKFTRVKGRLATPRSSHSAILLKSGEVLIAGGISPDGGQLQYAELFDPENLQFTPTRNMLLAVRVRPMLRLLPDGKVQVIGGDDQRSMEMFNAEGRYFTARARILPDSNSQTGIAEVMRAPSRSALINNHGSLKAVAGVGIPGLPIIEDPLDTLASLLDRSEHTITEMPETFSALVTGGLSSSGTTLMSTMTTSSSSATVTTDKTDYQPGETVIISGTNWQAGETVQLTLHRDNDTPDTVLSAVADPEGNISTSEYVVQESDLNVSFLLTAVGQTSGYTAQTTFTDSRTINSVTLNGRSSVTVAPGATITVVIFVSTSTTGGANWRSTSWRIATTPPGTTDCINHPNHDGVGFNGEVLSITAPTSAGVYNAYFIAFEDDVCATGASTVFAMTNAVTVVQTCAAPSITCPPAVNVQCDSNVPAPATDLASFVSQGGTASPSSPSCGSVSVTFMGDVSSGSCPKTITRTYRASDSSGNQATCTQTITVHDTTAPSLTCPPPVTVQCAADVPSHATDLAGLVTQGGSASDNCGVTPTVTFVSDVSSGSCPKTITRTYRATDACGNVTNCTQTITVRDTIAPTINCPPAVTVQCVADVPAHATDLAGLVAQGGNASDNCEAPTVTFVSDVSEGSCPKTITRTYRATDACGNVTNCTQTITVQDTIAPTITCPPAVTVQCAADVPAHATDLAGLVAQGGNATDNCEAPTVTFVSDVSEGSCPKTITRTYRATDGCGNSTECTQAITVNDTTAPSITCPPAITVQCDANVPPHATDLASLVTQGGNASDNCGVPAVTFVSDVASGSCPKTITRTYRATDNCGNSKECTQTITVHDTIAPSISCPPPVTVQCIADVPPYATDLAGLVAQLGNASDNCGTPSVTFVGDAPSGGCPMLIARTYRATDACGNQSTCTQLITVLDTIAPVITCPSDIVVQSRDSSDAVAVYDLPTATDNCVTPTVVCSPPSGSVFQLGVTRVTCTATDACGNSSSCSFSVGVRYDFFGFLSPVENPPLSNRVKAGQTIPLKFRLKSGQNIISDLAAVTHLESANLKECDRDRAQYPVDERGSSTVEYDDEETQYVINWRTKKTWANTCRKLVVTLNDSSTHTVYFEFVK
jgi:hypothetical protein